MSDLLRIRSDGLRPVVLVPDSLITELAQLFRPYDAAGGSSLDYSLEGLVGTTLDWMAQYDPVSLEALWRRVVNDLNSRSEEAKIHLALQMSLANCSVN
jgi:hypothetical protein